MGKRFVQLHRPSIHTQVDLRSEPDKRSGSEDNFWVVREKCLRNTTWLSAFGSGFGSPWTFLPSIGHHGRIHHIQ